MTANNDPRRVLVVDDDPVLRTVIVTALAKAGYDVSEASDGRRALDKVRDSKPDLVLLDITMPGMSGPEVAQAILHDWDSPPILMLSSHVSELREVAHLGVEVVSKPVNPDRLIRAVEESFLSNSGEMPVVSQAMLDTVREETEEDKKRREAIDRYKRHNNKERKNGGPAAATV